MSVGFPSVRVGEPVRYQALTVFPLFDGSQVPVEYLLSDEGHRLGMRDGRRGIRSRVSARSAGGEQGRCPSAVHRRRGTGRGEAEPNPEHVLADRRQEQDQDSRKLRGGRAVAVPFQTLWLQRQPFAVEAAVLFEEFGHEVAFGQARLSFRPGQGLGRGRKAAGIAGCFFGHQCDGRHLRDLQGSDGRIP